MPLSPPNSAASPPDPLAALADLLDPPADLWATPGHLQAHINPKAWDYPHLQLIDDHLVRLEQRTLGTRGLIITMQPRAGKSERCSRIFPTWYLRRHPRHRIVLGTYAAALGKKHSRYVRNLITTHRELGLRLDPGSRQVDDWELEASGGGMRTVGVGGSVTGMGADLLVIDDPVKNREQAESEVYREKTWDWWTDDLSTRLMVTDDDHGGMSTPVVLLMQTRWHEDDLAGRLLAREPEHWTVLNLPALAEDGDPLGRVNGGTLMPDRYGDEWMAEQQDRLGSYSFSALYQQRPAPAAGGFFQGKHFRWWRRIQGAAGELFDLDGRLVDPAACWRFATADTATSKKTSADWTVVASWAVTPAGDLLLLDRSRQRMEEGDLPGFITAAYRKHGSSFAGVEATFTTSRLAYELGRAGVAFRPLAADTDKVTRAIPAQVRLEQHRVWWPASDQAPFDIEEWMSELLSFPNGAHDDQVDTFSYAALQLTLSPRLPQPTPPQSDVDRLRASVARARKGNRNAGPAGRL